LLSVCGGGIGAGGPGVSSGCATPDAEPIHAKEPTGEPTTRRRHVLFDGEIFSSSDVLGEPDDWVIPVVREVEPRCDGRSRRAALRSQRAPRWPPLWEHHAVAEEEILVSGAAFRGEGGVEDTERLPSSSTRSELPFRRKLRRIARRASGIAMLEYRSQGPCRLHRGGTKAMGFVSDTGARF
jgi:hypothetical protein